MRITSRELKSAYKSYIQKFHPSSREGCPSEESMLLIFEQHLSSGKKKEVIDHVVKCAYCLKEFEFFLELHRQKNKVAMEIAGQLRREHRKFVSVMDRPKIWSFVSSLWAREHPLRRHAFIAAAVLIIAAVLVVSIRSILEPTLGEERGRLRDQVRLISPIKGKGVELPLIFRWQKVSLAQFYQLEIFDETLLPIWKSPPIGDFYFELPSKAAMHIKKNKAYFWTVTAVFQDGARKESRLERFILEERPATR